MMSPYRVVAIGVLLSLLVIPILQPMQPQSRLQGVKVSLRHTKIESRGAGTSQLKQNHLKVSQPAGCELYGNPPEWYVEELEQYGFSCEDRQFLNKLAYKESTWRDNVCNGIYCGLYQIGFSAREDCVKTGNNKSDHHCALWYSTYSFSNWIIGMESMCREPEFFEDVFDVDIVEQHRLCRDFIFN